MRTVLELKSAEMQELRKQNEKLQAEVEDLPAIVQKLEAAQSRVEDLNVQLQRKSEIEMYVYLISLKCIILNNYLNYCVGLKIIK